MTSPGTHIIHIFKTDASAGKGTARLVLLFVKSSKDIATRAGSAAKCAGTDGLLWFAYPKKSYKGDSSVNISHDSGWQPLGSLGYEGVRQVAIDDDWSALRFRHVDSIATLKRESRRAMSKRGKDRARVE